MAGFLMELIFLLRTSEYPVFDQFPIQTNSYFVGSKNLLISTNISTPLTWQIVPEPIIFILFFGRSGKLIKHESI